MTDQGRGGVTGSEEQNNSATTDEIRVRDYSITINLQAFYHKCRSFATLLGIYSVLVEFY